MKEQKYLKEEYHRGEWKPLFSKGKNKQSHVMITEEQAEWMNRNSKDKGIRFVLPKSDVVEEDKDEKKLLRAEYEELSGKNVFNNWTVDQLKEKIQVLKK